MRFVSDYRGGCRCFFNTKSPLMVVMLFYTVYFGSGYGVIAMWLTLNRGLMCACRFSMSRDTSPSFNDETISIGSAVLIDGPISGICRKLRWYFAGKFISLGVPTESCHTVTYTSADQTVQPNESLAAGRQSGFSIRYWFQDCCSPTCQDMVPFMTVGPEKANLNDWWDVVHSQGSI